MKIADFLDPTHVFVDVAAGSRKELLTAMLTELSNHLPPDRGVEDMVDLLEEHEVHCASCIDSMVAVPHLMVPRLPHSILAVARVRDNLVYDEGRGLKVSLVFLLLSPTERSGEHIRLLARLTRICRECDFATRASQVSSAEDLYSLIEDEDWRHI